MEVTFEQNDKVVEISSPQIPVSKFRLTLTILIFLLIFAGLAFGSGYFFGRAQLQAKQTTVSGKSTSRTVAGKTTFENPSEKFSIVFLENWKATERQSGIPGVLIQNEANSVELWLRVEQPFNLSKEQQESISATNKIKIRINEKEIELTEYVYNTGGYFSVAVLPATTKTTLATFWIKATDKENYTAALEIVKSFKFN